MKLPLVYFLVVIFYPLMGQEIEERTDTIDFRLVPSYWDQDTRFNGYLEGPATNSSKKFYWSLSKIVNGYRVRTIYYRQNRKKYECDYLLNQLHGICEVYCGDGSITQRLIYKKGVLLDNVQLSNCEINFDMPNVIL